jgi:hypothetical protein
MTTRLPTNVSFTCVARALTGLNALILPASDELVTMQGAPVGRLFNVTFDQTQANLQDGDLLVNEADATDSYRIRGVKHVKTPRLAHTHALAERGGAK